MNMSVGYNAAEDPQNAKDLSGYACEVEGAICEGKADYQCPCCRKPVCSSCSYDEICCNCLAKIANSLKGLPNVA
jgi:hypothetical protein